jgi:PAS domain S-box-containing protein
MMRERPRVLIIAAPAEHDLVRAALVGVDAELEAISSAPALDAALDHRPQAIVFAAGVPDLDFVTAQACWRSRGLGPICLVLDRTHDDTRMTTLLRAGATDYVSADRIARLPLALERELVRRRELAGPRPADTTSLLQAIVDGLPYVLFVKDAEELRIRIVNDLGLQMLGMSHDQLIGKLDHEYLPKEQADAFLLDDREVLATNKTKVIEEVARAQGVDLWFRTRKVPIRDVDGRRYVLGVTEEFTERRAADEALRHSRDELEQANRRLSDNLLELKKSRAVSARTLASYQQRALQMEIIRQQNEDLDRLAQDLARAKRIEEQRAREIESAARLKTEFLANFSHEIRTPLNGILGYCELLLREEGARLTPHGRRDLNVVKANAKTLLALINDILDLSKIEAGHVDVVKEGVGLAELIDECIATVREYLQGRPVEITATIAPEVTTVETDALKLRQILLNLLSNAAKFTQAGEIVIDVRRDDDALVVTVEDTGDGIPADQLPYIFDKFRQVDGSSTRKVGGTGLGLAIVRELCRVLGGTVTATSSIGRGSVFRVRLERVFDGTSARKTVITSRGSDRHEIAPGTTVLVVDDDPLIHQLLKGELEREGMSVVLAGDGVGALQAARAHAPSAIVLDMYLPKLDGWSVLSELKSDAVLAKIPVIIISVAEERARGFSLGACEYLVKPFEAQRLVEIVSRAVGTEVGEILVVDDDSATRELVCRQLRAAGFTATEARSGEEALLRARVIRPALMVLDLVMPGMSGFDVLTQLRSEPIPIPVVVLTGKSLSISEQQTLRDGMAAIVQKNGRSIEQIIEEAKRLLLAQRAQAAAKLPRVLYVEDSAQNRDVVRRYLSGIFDVLEAEDGEYGLDRAQRDNPALILMDLSLPRLDGWEATRRLKAGPLAAIPVVALTAHASREDQARARAAGCDGYLTKPVDRELLIKTIQQHLARARDATVAQDT